MLGLLASHVAELPVLPLEPYQRVNVALEPVTRTTEQNAIGDVVDSPGRARRVVVELEVPWIVKLSITTLALDSMLTE